MIHISTAEREAEMSNPDIDIEEAVVATTGGGFKTQNLGGQASFAQGVISEDLIFTMLRGVSLETLIRAGWYMPQTPEEMAKFMEESPEESVQSFANGKTDGFKVFDLLIEDVRLYRIVCIPSLKEKGRFYVGTMVMSVVTEGEDQTLGEPEIDIMSFADRPKLN